MGHLCDGLHVTTVILISTLGSTISVFLFWGLGVHLHLLVLFAVTYGFFAGGFSAIWVGMMKEVQKGCPGSRMGTLMGVFAAGRGIGAVASGPVSEALVARWRRKDGGGMGFGYRTEYGRLILFTSVSAFLGLVCFRVRRTKLATSAL
jgi:MFS family permease